MNWNWDPIYWKRSTRVLLGLATIWPVIYIGLFFVVIFSFFIFAGFASGSSDNTPHDIDLIQLERKINDGELKELILRDEEFVATDRVGNQKYRVYVRNRSTRAEILRQARELNAQGQQRVPRVEEQPAPSLPAGFPAGFAVLFIAHMGTIFLSMGLMPLYIILAVKSTRFDETMRIVWVILICMLGMFAMPVYWYLYVWRKPANGEAIVSTKSE